MYMFKKISIVYYICCIIFHSKTKFFIDDQILIKLTLKTCFFLQNFEQLNEKF